MTAAILATSTAPLQPGITTNPTGAQGGSSLSEPHPDYSARRPDWVSMFDSNEGQRHIKSKTTTYLPSTSGMRALSNTPTKLDGEGLELYQAYIIRAFFPDLAVLYTSSNSNEAVRQVERLEDDAELLGRPCRTGDLARRVRAVLGDPQVLKVVR